MAIFLVQVAAWKSALCAVPRLTCGRLVKQFGPAFMPKKPQAKKLTRDDKRNLDIEIGFIEGVIRKDPDYIEALQILGDDYTKRGRFEDGMKVDEQLARLRPQDATVLYNLACSYSLMGQTEHAFSTLHRAISAGYDDFKWMAQDPDLESLRKHPLYEQVRAKIKTVKPKAKSA
jgi:tetratricopeptide (TPR) repeat protein